MSSTTNNKVESKNEQREKELMRQACELALTSVNKNCGPFGCIITDKDYNIISEGNNMVTELNDPTAHAEIMAIRKACKNKNSFIIDGYKLFSSCEPCPMCLSAIYWSKIKDIYYSNTREDAKNIGFDDDYIYEEIKKDINDREIKLKKIKSENSLDSFISWSEQENKIEY